ncbi:MAG: DUF4373 domain-containing protein, partial [Clostridia bacterium]|nr:DUF4373 domain-containing protein [Clostridia bacterium]
PLDVHLDEKFELIEAEFGLKGFAVIVKLFQRIYGQQGYYCEWTNEVALMFSKGCMLGINVVSEIVMAAIKRGIFDSTLYEKYGILTSVGIQKRYLEACTRRKEVTIKKAYLLLCNTQNFKNVNISGENVYISSKNADISKQSKRKEKRRDYSKVKDSTDALSDNFQPPTVEIIQTYCDELGLHVNAQRFHDYYSTNGWIVGDGTPMQDWKACIRIWAVNEKRNSNKKSDPHDSEYEQMVQDYVPTYRKKKR